MSVLAALGIWVLGSILFGMLAARFLRAFRSVPHPLAGRLRVAASTPVPFRARVTTIRPRRTSRRKNVIRRTP